MQGKNSESVLRENNELKQQLREANAVILSLRQEVDALRLTQLVMDVVDAEIRKDPGQWFWYNKRWILDPLEPETGAEPAPPEPATTNPMPP